MAATSRPITARSSFFAVWAVMLSSGAISDRFDLVSPNNKIYRRKAALCESVKE